MADFCAQCTVKYLGLPPEKNDFVGVTDEVAWKLGMAAVVLCEGCGPCQVDPQGRCISEDCSEFHAEEAKK